MDEQLLTLKEFAKRYGVCTKTAGKWIRKFKDLEVMRIGHKFYFSPDSLEDWEQNRVIVKQKVPKMVKKSIHL